MEYSEYRQFEVWEEWERYATTVSEVPNDATRVMLYRNGNSSKGLSLLTTVEKLKARQVNQDFLEEIARLPRLRYLKLDVVTAKDLTPLWDLHNLECLKVEGLRHASVEDLAPVLSLAKLTKLFITNAKHIDNISFLSDAQRIESLGIEGSMWTTQVIESLSPLSGLARLQSLFMTSTRLKNTRLSFLASIPNLTVLECARFAPKREFDELRSAKPNLQCSWCDKYEI